MENSGRRRLTCVLAALGLLAAGPTPSAHAHPCVDYGAYAHWVGSLTVPHAARVEIDGDHAYVLRPGGLDVVDVSNPTTLAQLGSLILPNATRDVAAQSGFTYVAVDSAGISIVNATNPAAPFLAGSLITPGPAQGIAITGGWAFVACGSAGLQVVDISNPTSPALAGSIDTPGFACDVSLTGTLACLMDRDSKLHVIDVSNPESPVIVGARVMPGRRVAAEGSRVYVAGGTAADVIVIDIANPAAPYELFAIGAPDVVNDVAAVGTTVYVAYGFDYPEPPCGVLIVDASSASAPVVVGKLIAGSKITSIACSAGHIFGIQSIWDEVGFLHAFAIPSPGSPPAIGSFPAAYVMTHVVPRATKAYVAEIGAFNQNHRLRVLDVTSPSTPLLIGEAALPAGAEAIALAGDYAYVAGGPVVVVDVSGPPAVVGLVNILGNARDVVVSGNYAYAVEGSGGLSILDLTAPAAPVLVGGVSVPGHARRVEVAGSYAYLNSEQGVQVVDVSNPTAPVLAGFLPTPMPAWVVEVVGGIGVVGVGHMEDLGEILILDMVNPAAPVVIGSAVTPGFVSDVKIDGTRVYVCQSEMGALLFDISNPSAPVVVGASSASERAVRAEVSGGMIFLAGSLDGLSIIPTPCVDATGVEPSRGEDALWTLSPAWPNPMRGETTFRLDLPGSDDVRLEIFDVTGRLVRSIVQGRLAAGPHAITWDGRDDNGAAVSSGLYLVGLSSPRGAATGRVTLIR